MENLQPSQILKTNFIQIKNKQLVLHPGSSPSPKSLSKQKLRTKSFASFVSSNYQQQQQQQ